MLFATALAAGVFLTLVFLFLPEILVHFFVGETDPAAPVAINGFPYFAVGILFFMFNVCIVGYFQSLELMKPALTLMFLRGFLLLIPAFILLPKLIGISGIWLAMPLSETLTFIVGIILFSKIKRTNP